jgi:hypothetical protein
LMSMWFFLVGFIFSSSWCTIFKLHCNAIHTSYSSSQLYCFTQVSASVFTESNT